jgi:hypothetical protein
MEVRLLPPEPVSATRFEVVHGVLRPSRLAGRDETEDPSDRCADRRPQRPGRRRGDRPPEERVVRTRTNVSGLGRELIESDAETEAHGPDESGSTKLEGPFVSTDTSEGDAEKSAREGPKDDEPGDGLNRRHFKAAAEHVGPGLLVYPRPAFRRYTRSVNGSAAT